MVSSYPPRHCGIGAYARDQVSRLRAEGHDVTVLCPPDGDGDVRAPFEGGRAFLGAARIGRAFDRVLVHFQPGLYYRPRAPLSKVATSAALLWLVVRRPNAEVLVHEADDPVRWRPDYVLLRMAFHRARLLFHTEAERASLERRYRVRVRATLMEHRVSPVVGPVPSKPEARALLEIGRAAEPVFVCAGFLQPSKGFDRAVRAFARAGGGSLFVVGSVREQTPENLAHAEELLTLCRETVGATLVRRFLPDEEFDLWVLAADRVVLPYRRSWSSGVLARAHALGTPAIVSGAGGLAEQAGPGDTVVRSHRELEAALRGLSAGRSARRTRAGAKG